MGVLVSEFLKNKDRFLRRKHQISTTRQKTRESVVIRFLEFVESSRGVKKVKNLQQKDYDGFIRHLKEEGLSEETLRNYKGILREFFVRAHLKIKVNPTRSRNKKLGRLRKILEERGCIDIFEEVSKLL